MQPCPVGVSPLLTLEVRSFATMIMHLGEGRCRDPHPGVGTELPALSCINSLSSILELQSWDGPIPPL